MPCRMIDSTLLINACCRTATPVGKRVLPEENWREATAPGRGGDRGGRPRRGGPRTVAAGGGRGGGGRGGGPAAGPRGRRRRPALRRQAGHVAEGFEPGSSGEGRQP